MRIKYIKSIDLDEIESTVNYLLSLGWEIYTQLDFQTNGEYLISMITSDRRPEYYAEAGQTGQRVAPIRYAEIRESMEERTLEAVERDTTTEEECTPEAVERDTTTENTLSVRTYGTPRNDVPIPTESVPRRIRIRSEPHTVSI
uniref:Uncharacterized protein n=1 Tax=viral metagenome TaxID=1070528 RepID=A0A6M3KDE0_9ZZZZ